MVENSEDEGLHRREFLYVSGKLTMLVLGAALAGCGGGGSSKTVNSNPTSTPVPTGGSLPSGTVAFADIRSVGTEGVIAVADANSSVAVIVPPACFSYSAPLSIQVNVAPSLNPAYTMGGTALDISITPVAFADPAKTITVRGQFNANNPAGERYVLLLYAGVPLALTASPVTGAGPEAFEVSFSMNDVLTVQALAQQLGMVSSASRQADLGSAVGVGVYAVATILHDKAPNVELKRFFDATESWGYVGFQGKQSNYMGGTWYSRPWNDGKRRCVVLHGINNDLSNMHKLAQHLSNAKASDGSLLYDEVWGAEYEWCAGIRDNARLLAEALVARKISENAPKLDMYGHSMGGLVTRWCIEQEGMVANTSRVFLLGTPSSGVPVNETNAHVLFSFWKCSGQGIRDLIRDESINNFQRALNDGVQPPDRGRIPYFTVAGFNPDYFGLVGDRSTIFYTGADKEHDGIVPVPSAEYELIGDKSKIWADQHNPQAIAPYHSYSIKIYKNHSDLKDAQDTKDAITVWLSATEDMVERWEAIVGDVGFVIK